MADLLIDKRSFQPAGIVSGKSNSHKQCTDVQGDADGAILLADGDSLGTIIMIIHAAEC